MTKFSVSTDITVWKDYRSDELMNSLSPSYIARPIITNFDMRASNVEWKICREMTSTLIHRAPAWSYTAQRYAQARSLLSSSVRLSVCHVVKLLARTGSPITLVFLWLKYQNPSVGVKNQRGGKFCDFQQKSLFISETVRDRPLVAVER